MIHSPVGSESLFAFEVHTPSLTHEYYAGIIRLDLPNKVTMTCLTEMRHLTLAAFSLAPSTRDQRTLDSEKIPHFRKFSGI